MDPKQSIQLRTKNPFKPKEEQFVKTIIHNMVLLAREIIMALTCGKNYEVRKLLIGTFEGQWNYIMSSNWGEVYVMLQRLKAQSVVDLGAGMGIGLFVMKTLMQTLGHPTIEFYGYERYEELSEVANRLRIMVNTKDIFKLTKKDLAKHDVLYMYEPAEDNQLAQKMVNHIADIMSPHQTLLYTPAGSMLSYLYKHPMMQPCETNNKATSVKIFKLATGQTHKEGKGVARSRAKSGRTASVHQ